jgi:hypothetical protein
VQGKILKSQLYGDLIYKNWGKKQNFSKFGSMGTSSHGKYNRNKWGGNGKKSPNSAYWELHMANLIRH